MALMSDQQRRACWAELMASLGPGTPMPLDKNALRRCVDANDAVINSHAGAINSEIQGLEPSWNQLSQAVKSRVHSAVIKHRYDNSVV